MTLKSNYNSRPRVYQGVKPVLHPCLVLMLAVASGSGFDFYSSARQKVDLIEGGSLRPGARVELSARELNAFAEREVPAGVRNPKLVLTGSETLTGTALVDFGKLQRAQGYEPGWLMSKLLDGEHPVSVTARIQSGEGKVRVDIQRAAIAGLEVDGKTLDFLIRNFILPFYPQAMVGRQIPMAYRIERLQLAPTGVAVLIGR